MKTKNEWDFNSFLIKKFRPQNDTMVADSDGIKYHYTSPDAFLSILKYGKIRFTDIKYMNDKAETVYFLKSLLDYMEKHSEHQIIQEVINLLIDKNSFDSIKDLSISEIKYNNIPYYPYSPKRTFLFCLSDESDSLNMWNYYVKNGQYQGYNIGFKIHNFLNTFDTPDDKHIDALSVYYGNVIYDKNKQTLEIEHLINEIESFVSSSETNTTYYLAALMLRTYIDSAGLFFKNINFKSEEEYRIILEIDDKKVPHNKSESEKYFGENNKNLREDFCTKNGLVVPFIEVSIPKDSISRITISPITEYAIAKESIHEVLKINGYDSVKVYKSQIPIRY